MERLAYSLLNAIAEHAERELPRECCGLIVELSDGLAYWPCRNVRSVLNQFQIHAEDWTDAEDTGTIKMIVHSHVDGDSEPTQPDLVGCELHGLPWFIYACRTKSWRIITPSGYRLPLLGRQFYWGLSDCFTLLRDYYRDELGIGIATPAEGYAPKFWQQGQRFYSRFSEFGFVAVPQDEPPRIHDVFLMLIRSDDEPNHAGIYLGDGVMLHHLEERLSERVQYGGYWQKSTRYTVRHKSLC